VGGNHRSAVRDGIDVAAAQTLQETSGQPPTDVENSLDTMTVLFSPEVLG